MTLSFSANTVKELFSSLPFSSSMTNASMNNSASSLLTSFSFTLSQSQAYSTSLVIFTMTAAFATLYQKYTFASLVGGIYNAIIVNMTQVWYKRVLEKQNDGATILDVGIGTAGELLLLMLLLLMLQCIVYRILMQQCIHPFIHPSIHLTN